MKTSVPVVERMRPLEIGVEHAEAFNALAHDSRLRVFFFLARARGEQSAGQIQDAVGIPAPTLSHHLAMLRRAALIQSRREDRHIYYSVNAERVSDLVRVLTDCC